MGSQLAIQQKPFDERIQKPEVSGIDFGPQASESDSRDQLTPEWSDRDPTPVFIRQILLMRNS